MKLEPISTLENTQAEESQVSVQEQLSDEEIVRMVEQERGAPRESRVPLIAFCGALISCFIILPAAFARLHSATPTPASTPRGINWTYSFEDGQNKAHQSHQKMFIDFYAEWCGDCKTMDSAVYNQPEIYAESSGIVPVKINADNRPDLAQRYNVRVLPSLVWTDERGNETARQEGTLSSSELARLMKQNR